MGLDALRNSKLSYEDAVAEAKQEGYDVSQLELKPSKYQVTTKPEAEARASEMAALLKAQTYRASESKAPEQAKSPQTTGTPEAPKATRLADMSQEDRQKVLATMHTVTRTATEAAQTQNSDSGVVHTGKKLWAATREKLSRRGKRSEATEATTTEPAVDEGHAGVEATGTQAEGADDQASRELKATRVAQSTTEETAERSRKLAEQQKAPEQAQAPEPLEAPEPIEDDESESVDEPKHTPTELEAAAKAEQARKKAAQADEEKYGPRSAQEFDAFAMMALGFSNDALWKESRRSLGPKANVQQIDALKRAVMAENGLSAEDLRGKTDADIAKLNIPQTVLDELRTAAAANRASTKITRRRPEAAKPTRKLNPADKKEDNRVVRGGKAIGKVGRKVATLS